MKCLRKLHSDSGLMENTKGRYVIHYVALSCDKFKFFTEIPILWMTVVPKIWTMCQNLNQLEKGELINSQEFLKAEDSIE